MAEVEKKTSKKDPKKIKKKKAMKSKRGKQQEKMQQKKRRNDSKTVPIHQIEKSNFYRTYTIRNEEEKTFLRNCQFKCESAIGWDWKKAAKLAPGIGRDYSIQVNYCQGS